MNKTEREAYLAHSQAELTHYGVKGMRWGHRSGGDSSVSGADSRSKPTSTEIKTARKAHNQRMTDLASETRVAYKSRDKAEIQSQLNKIHSQAKEARKSPDFDTAFAATRGEKAASVLLAGPLGPLLVNSQMKSQKQFADAILEEYGDLHVSDYKYDK